MLALADRMATWIERFHEDEHEIVAKELHEQSAIIYCEGCLATAAYRTERTRHAEDR